MGNIHHFTNALRRWKEQLKWPLLQFKQNKTCDIQGCEKEAKLMYGPIGVPVEGTGEVKDCGEWKGFQVAEWTGKKQYKWFFECHEHA